MYVSRCNSVCEAIKSTELVMPLGKLDYGFYFLVFEGKEYRENKIKRDD